MSSQDLTQQQALELLVNGVQVAQRKGAFSLEEAELLARACRVFVVKQDSTTPSSTPGPQTPVQQQSLQPVNDPQNIQTI